MGGVESRAEKNSSAAKQADFRPHEDGREGSFEVGFRQRIGVFRDEFLVHHNR